MPDERDGLGTFTREIRDPRAHVGDGFVEDGWTAKTNAERRDLPLEELLAEAWVKTLGRSVPAAADAADEEGAAPRANAAVMAARDVTARGRERQ